MLLSAFSTTTTYYTQAFQTSTKGKWSFIIQYPEAEEHAKKRLAESPDKSNMSDAEIAAYLRFKVSYPRYLARVKRSQDPFTAEEKKAYYVGVE